MTTIKSDNSNLEVETEKDDVIFKSAGEETARIKKNGTVTSQASTSDIDAVGIKAVPTKEYVSPYTHKHSNITTLNNTTSAYTTTQESKLAGIAVGAQADQTNTELNALNFTSYKVDGATLSTATGLGTSNTLIPTQNASKVYIDGKWDTHFSTYHPIQTAFWGGRSTTQSIAPSTTTKVWNTQINDQAGDFDGSKFTCVKAGYYRFCTHILFSSVAWPNGATVYSYIFRNGGNLFSNRYTLSVADTCYMAVTTTGLYYFNVNDYAEQYCHHTNTVNVNIYASNIWTGFSGNRIVRS